jgi:hypothetical protein
MTEKNAGRLQGGLIAAVLISLLIWVFFEADVQVIAGTRLREAESRRAQATGIAEVWQQELLRCNGRKGVKPYSSFNKPIDVRISPPDYERNYGRRYERAEEGR